MHDVFHGYLPSEEADGALGQLGKRDAPRAMFTMAKCRLGKQYWQHTLDARRRGEGASACGWREKPRCEAVPQAVACAL